ncbi:MAG: response regulator [Patescibacteria group bacterium]
MAKILIVEDEKDLLEVYKDTLEANGHEVDTADDGEVAFDKMKQGGYDLVLLDIILPKINGLLIMQKLKEEFPSPQNPNKTVVFLTNLDRNEEINQGIKLADGYLIKSKITPDDLVREVNLYLSSAELSHQEPAQ